jgi:hypothetical protein
MGKKIVLLKVHEYLKNTNFDVFNRKKKPASGLGSKLIVFTQIN